MKANILNIQKTYSEIPGTWEFEGVTYQGYEHFTDLHFAHGWRDVVIPTITTYQRLSDTYILVNDIVTKEVIDFTEEEIEAYNRSLIPSEISRMKFEIQLYITTTVRDENNNIVQLGKTFQDIIDYINSLQMSSFYKNLLKMRLLSCVTLERDNDDLNALAPGMGISQAQLDEIFINGNSLS